MADTEHTLRLKAVLDTEDVQAKLSQLKSQQVRNGGAQNGQSVNGLLQKLNLTLQSLQRSIDRLASREGRTSRGPQGGVSVNRGGVSPAPFALSPGQFSAGRRLQAPAVPPDGRRLFLRPDPLRRMLLPDSQTGRRLLAAASDYGRLTPAQYRAAVPGFYRSLNSAEQAQFMADSRVGLRTRPRTPPGGFDAWSNPGWFGSRVLPRRAPEPGRPSGGMTRQTRSLAKMGVGFVFGAVAGGAADYAEATGRSKTAAGLNIAAGVGTGAGTGALVGGPVGAAIGAAVGLVTSSFQELAKSARETASALQLQHQAVFRGQDVDNSLYETLRSQRDRKAFKNQDRSYFESQLAEEKQLYRRTAGWMKTEVGLGGKGWERFNLREYERNTEELMKVLGRKDPEVVRRQRVSALYASNARNLQESDARIQELERALESLGKAPLNQAKASAARSEVDRLEEALRTLKTPDLGNVNSLASQGYMISESDDFERLDEATKYLRSIEQITRQIKDAREEAAVYG